VGPIGSAVLTFIGYKQTDKQTDKPNLYIDGRFIYRNSRFKNVALNMNRKLGYEHLIERYSDVHLTLRYSVQNFT